MIVKNIDFIVLSILLTLLSNCDRVNNVLINGNSYVQNIKFECGTIDIRVTTFENRHFFIRQDYSIHNEREINLNPDSLKIMFKNELIPYFLIGTNNIDPNSKIALNGNGYLKIEFHLDQEVKIGDTIKLYTKNYIKCDNKIIPTSTINLIIEGD